MGFLKDSLGLGISEVYKILWSCGAECIGHTGRSIAVRQKEHQKYLHLGQTEKSALAHHGCSTGNAICFDNTEILVNVSSFDIRLVRESLEIRLEADAINKDDGMRLSDIATSIRNTKGGLG